MAPATRYPRLLDWLMVRSVRKVLPPAHRSKFNADLADVMASEAAFLTDRVTHGHILFVASVLCVYRGLRRSGLAEEAAKDRIARALCKIGQRTTAAIMWLACALARDKLQTIRTYSRTKSQQAYGPAFRIEDTDNAGGFVSQVHVCGYRTFLRRHHAVEINEVLCAWDKVWIDALPQGIKFTRPSTLASGGQSCRFEFRQK